MTIRRSLTAAIAAVVVHDSRRNRRRCNGWRDVVPQSGTISSPEPGSRPSSVPRPLPPLPTMHVFTTDGSDERERQRVVGEHTESYGAWERVDGRLYAASGVFYRFNAAGTSRVDDEDRPQHRAVAGR